MSSSVRIIGIDPGLRRTGWGVVDCAGTHLVHVADGVVISDERLTLAERLVQLRDRLAAVVAAWHPDEAAVEETFVSRDARATLKLGQARAVALMVPAAAGLAVAEYAPNTVKKTVVGTGHAEKEQIRRMIGMLLPRAKPASADAADALAIAICHAHCRTSHSLLGAQFRS